MAHVAENLHWYTRTGQPMYEVSRADGKGMRPTTLRDAKIFGLVPSVTQIIRQAAAPGLEIWKQQQVLMAALTLPRKPEETEAQYLSRVMQDSREQARKAAERGTAIHAAIQGHYEGIAPDPELFPHVMGAKKELEDHFGTSSWTAEKAFAHPDGFGGKVDLHFYRYMDGGAVVDVKTKEFDAEHLPDGYDEQCMQVSAYAYGLGLKGARCANLFVSSSVPGLAYLHEWAPSDVKRALKMFLALLEFWKSKNLAVA